MSLPTQNIPSLVGENFHFVYYLRLFFRAYSKSFPPNTHAAYLIDSSNVAGFPCQSAGCLGDTCAGHMTRGGVAVVLGSVAEGQDDVEAMVRVLQGGAVDYLR